MPSISNPTHRPAVRRLLLVLSLAALGCGGGGEDLPLSDAALEDAATADARVDGAAPAHPTSAQWASACDDYVDLYCAATNRCFSFYGRQVWGDQSGAGGSATADAMCATHYLPRCLALYEAPGVTDAVMQAFITYTAGWKADAEVQGVARCFAAFDLEAAFAWPIRSTPGTLAAGTSCFDTVQCGAGLRCSGEGRCGTCVPTLAAGAPCTSENDCAMPLAPTEPPLLCRSGVCDAEGGAGASCEEHEDCQRLLLCVDGSCKPAGVLGDACGHTSPCETEYNSLVCSDFVCEARGVLPASDGAPCNFDYVGGGLCSASSLCLERPTSVDGHPAVTTSNGPTTTYEGLTGVLLDGGTCDAPVGGAGGKIVLCQRGGMGFEQKAANAAGAIAVVVYNVAGSDFPTGINAGAASVPVLLVETASGAALLAKVGMSVTLYGRGSGICRAPAGEGQSCGPDVANCAAALECAGATCRRLEYTCD